MTLFKFGIIPGIMNKKLKNVAFEYSGEGYILR